MGARGYDHPLMLARTKNSPSKIIEITNAFYWNNSSLPMFAKDPATVNRANKERLSDNQLALLWNDQE